MSENKNNCDIPTLNKLDTNPKVVNSTTELLKPIPTKVVEQNLDNVLEAVKTVDQTCDYKKCKQKTNLMGSDCCFCKQRFCFKHGLPEVHGCGEAVKKQERTEFLHPLPAKTVQAKEDLAKAKVKLEQKLKSMSIQRGPKPSGSGGKKTKGKNK